MHASLAADISLDPAGSRAARAHPLRAPTQLVAPSCPRAAKTSAMEDTTNLVRQLGADTEPREQKWAVATIFSLCCEAHGNDAATLEALAAAGAIPALARMLGPLYDAKLLDA
jgi:hypothetical protein